MKVWHEFLYVKITNVLYDFNKIICIFAIY